LYSLSSFSILSFSILSFSSRSIKDKIIDVYLWVLNNIASTVESRYPGLRRFLVELLSNIVRRNFNLICPAYYKEKSLVPLTTSSFIVKCNFFLIKCTFFLTFFSAAIDGRDLIFGHKLHIGTPYCGKRFWTRQIPTSCLPKSGVS
jgi:hypothetical protein